MSVVIFFGTLYVFITPGFSSCTKTNDSYTWLESLDACIRINMTLASQHNVRNNTFLSPSEFEPYWIQQLDITKMFPKENYFLPYNESYIIQINNDFLPYQCTENEGSVSCFEQANDAKNLIRLRSFSRIYPLLFGNNAYRIGSVNYTSLLNDISSTTLIRCVLYYSGKVFSDDCSTRRRAICVRDEFQKYAVSKLDEGLPRYAQQPLSTTGASSTIIDTTSYSFEIEITPDSSSSTSSLPAVAGGIGAGVMVSIMAVVALLLWRRYHHRSQHTDDTQIHQIHAQAVRGDAVNKHDYEGLHVNNTEASTYLQLNDISLQENRHAASRPPDNDSYEKLHPYTNNDIQMYSSLQIPKMATDTEKVYENTRK